MPRPTYPKLLSALTLGTARRELSGAVGEWLDTLAATDPTADGPEHLLAALALTERAHRLETTAAIAINELEVAGAEAGLPPSARLAKGLQLILEGTYPDLLDEGISIVLDRQTYVPASLLPALHPRAAALINDDYERAVRYVKASGNRGEWLARQHPDWAVLSATYDHAAAWKMATQPGERSIVLGQWRRTKPRQARGALDKIWSSQKPPAQEILLRGMTVNLSQDDHEWLREALQPKRKGVRRQLTRLLLRSGEARAIEDFTFIARAALRKDGKLTSVLTDERTQELLDEYGGVKSPETLEQLLPEILPPATWDELVELPRTTFWISLRPLELRGLARAIITSEDPEILLSFADYLLTESPPKFDAELAEEIARRLSDTDFKRLYDKLLTQQQDALRLRALPRRMALHRRSAWSERLSRAMITRLIDDLRSRQLDYVTQRELVEDWKRATPLIDPEIFPWLRQQLHATTERYDAFGKLALELLQTTAFRRELHKA